MVAAGVLAAPVAQASPAPEFTPAPVQWGPCAAERLATAGAECGFVEVPLDYDDPAGATIRVAVSRVRHTVPDAEYQGVMLVNPGGPGGSGLGLSLLGGAIPNGVGASYDWIGFDPRGVGASEPALSCIPDYAGYNRPDFQPEAGTEQAWLDRSEAYANACAENGGPLLDNLTSIDNVRDMDTIRRALGQEQINYYGFSYGTYLGQVYSTLFPDRVRRIVLDGVVNSRDIWYESNLGQDVAFQTNIEVFFDWIAKYDDVYGLGTSGEDVEALYYATQDELREAPAGGLIGPAEWNELFLGAGYNVGLYTGIAEAFSAWVNQGDPAGLIDVYGFDPEAPDDNGYAIYLATICTDLQWPQDYDTVRSDNTRVDAIAPFETWANAWFNGPCSFWQGEVGTPVEVDGSGVESALLLSETFDGATPFAGALQARRDFPTAVLVEGVGGYTHSASLSGIACTDDLIADYLATGALPERVPGDGSDVQCEPVPQPVPVAPDGA